MEILEEGDIIQTKKKHSVLQDMMTQANQKTGGNDRMQTRYSAE